ncbi:MAG: hypothetical protein KDI44_14285 [Thiothrix sp.]|nr:hypothetical protein [Thiothrix sp.]HPQ95363.1 hypothetical protein [Thiolinea sp.]
MNGKHDFLGTPPELELIESGIALASLTPKNPQGKIRQQDLLHARNIRLLLSRFPAMPLAGRLRAVHNMRNLLEQIANPVIQDAVNAEITRTARQLQGGGHHHGTV